MGIDWLNTLLVSASMSVDCMTIGVTDGIREPAMRKRKQVAIALVFGLFQSAMPIIGYFILYAIVHFGLSQSVQDSLTRYIPWIAFALLSFLGIKNIIEWIKEEKERKKGNTPCACEETGACAVKKDEPKAETPAAEKRLSVGEILVQGVATSIDALCIGFVYSPVEYAIPQAMIVFTVIGVVTFLFSLTAMFLGKKIGCKLVRWAGLIAGIVFIAIGLKILLEGIL
jgi:putative Mn2+ efflux pump MntP